LLGNDGREGFKVLLHDILISSASQAVARVKFRVLTGGHHVPEEDIRRRYERSVKHFAQDYLPLADEWGLWENMSPPAAKIAGNLTHTKQEAINMITSSKLQESEPMKYSEMEKIVLEASRVATEKMMHLYERMGIKVTPEITLAPDSPPPSFKPFDLW
jgi:hypothetical protein